VIIKPAKNYTVANTWLYPEEWSVKLQERLGYPTNWKDVCRVEYTNSKVLINPYMSTVPSLQSHTRGTAYTHQTLAITTDSITIDQSKIIPMFVDRADEAQTPYSKQMEMADLQGTLCNEYLESMMLGAYGDMTSFDATQIGGSAGNISVDGSNIDDIIRAVKREIGEANGQALMDKNGAFIVWRYSDKEYLEQFCQANGFNLADKALKDGVPNGYYFMEMYHYVSNSHTSGHLIAGVRKLLHMGILKATYGQVVIDKEPATADGPLSGTGIVSRLDWKIKVWNNIKPLLFDITVA
jgi:hypothetical protein